MKTKKLSPEEIQLEGQRKLEEDRQKLIVQRVKLSNGATFTRLKPVTAG
jgi:hypothetical protein